MSKAEQGLAVGLPPARFAGLTSAESRALVAALGAAGAERELALVWAEKLRRFVQAYRLGLARAVQERCGPGDVGILPMVELLLAAACDSQRPLPDAATLNAALLLLDLRQCRGPSFAPARERAGEILHLLRERLLERARAYEPGQGDAFPALPHAVGADSLDAWPVVVLSPNPYGLYTLLTLSLLERVGVPVRGVICRRLLSTRRVRLELARDGRHLIRKIWRKLVLRRDEYAPEADGERLTSVLDSLGVPRQSLYRYCRDRGIPTATVNDMNDPAAHRFLQAHPPHLVLFTGGGLIREATLALCGEGVLNCHHGILPQFKGMDVDKWPLLEGDFGQVGLTVHLMDTGVDTGPILMRHYVDPAQHATPQSMLNSFAARMGHLLVEAVLAYARGDIKPEPQEPRGRQYYYTHPLVAELVPEVFEELSARWQADSGNAAASHSFGRTDG